MGNGSSASFESSFDLRSAGARRLARPLTETERNWLRALAITVGSVVFFGIVYAVELRLGRWNPALRLVRDPSATAMLVLGISHFAVALFFTATSKSMRSVRAWGAFLGMLVVGIGAGAAYATIVQVSGLLAAVLFAFYFLVHDFRDQVFFYFTNRDSADPTDRTLLGSALLGTPFLVGGAAFCILAAVAGRIFPDEPLVRDGVLRFSGLSLVLWLLAAALLLLLAFLRLRRLADLPSKQALLQHFRTHRPIYLVFAGTFLVLAAGLALGARSRLIVLMHVATWYVFSVRQIRARAGASPSNATSGLAWLKGTLPGFRLIHVGSALVLALVGLVWAYGFRNDPGLLPVQALLDENNFAYWTILHVTVSFRGR